jgi:hypothetical protein
MNPNRGAEGATFARRYDQYRDDSGAWTFDIAEYEDDLESLIPGSISSDPTPAEAYQMAVYLEGFIERQEQTSNWSDEALDWFEAFESTLEFEAVATALREIAENNGL